MQKRLIGLAPILVVAAAMGYLCWSHLGDNAPLTKAKPAAKTTDLTAAQLSPPPTPDIVRDPFESAIAAASSTPSGKGPSGKNPAGESDDDPNSEAGEGKTHTAKKTAKSKSDSKRNTFDPGQFVLNGTYVHGRTRMAVINGAIYTEGQLLSAAKSEAPVGSVKTISVDKVELAVDDHQVALTYPNRQKLRPRDTEPSAIAMGVEPHVTSHVPTVGGVDQPTSMPPTSMPPPPPPSNNTH
jgi:hypothetical protein